MATTFEALTDPTRTRILDLLRAFPAQPTMKTSFVVRRSSLVIFKGEISRTDHQAAQPHPGLRSLDKLVGTWNVAGPDIKGQVRFEWMVGGFFLVQHVDFNHGGNHIKGLEIIGYEQPFGAETPSEHIKSHWFGNGPETLEYVYEVDDETLMIWAVDKGFPAYYKGTWSTDGNTNSGGWVYPGGGGYESMMTRP